MQLKEENYQEGFLREIFVQTLGYTINPDENYNLTTEFKNQKDSRKADGAILKDALKVISFNVWYAKKFSIPIETHKTSYKEYPVHFLTLTDKQVENINIEYDAYIEQLSISDKNPKPIVKQATLF
jgi:hypothetical protein